MENNELIPAGVSFDNMGSTFFVVGLINKYNNEFQAVADSLFDEISWKQVFFLNCITLFKEPPTIKDVSQFVGCSHQNAMQILTKLKNVGFITLTQDKDDKRKQRIALTDKAQVFRQKYTEPSAKVMQKLFENVNADALDTTIKVLTQLEYQLKKYQEGTK